MVSKIQRGSAVQDAQVADVSCLANREKQEEDRAGVGRQQQAGEFEGRCFARRCWLEGSQFQLTG